MEKFFYQRDQFFDLVMDRILPVDVILDVGTGVRPFYKIPCNVHICIEPWGEYIDIINNCHPEYPSFVYLKTDALSGIRLFPDKSVDTVCMVDLIEHLDKSDGVMLLEEAQRVSRKQILVYTPLGFVSNHTEGKDAWGLNGAALQEHKSGWLPEDFGSSWEFHICEKFILKEEHHVHTETDIGSFWAINNITCPNPAKIAIPAFVIEEVKKASKELSMGTKNQEVIKLRIENERLSNTNDSMMIHLHNLERKVTALSSNPINRLLHFMKQRLK